MKLLTLLVMALVFSFPSPLLAASFHWVDMDGFHSVDQVTKVPLEHRLELPMVKNQMALPFTAEEDKDGAMYIWFVLNQSGIAVPYTKTADIPNSPVFSKVDQPRAGDIAWWKGFVAIVHKSDAKPLTALGVKSRKTLEKKLGKVTWFRYIGPIETTLPVTAKQAPKSSLKTADKWLARLDKAAEYPLQTKDPAEIEKLKSDWKLAVTDLEALRKNFPDDPNVIRILGVIYRRGFTLEMPGAWERAEAYLLRATTLAPKSADAFISLGILYGDTAEGLEKQAEKQFRKALKVARKDQRPHIWWGLAIALQKQGRKTEALKTIDRLIKLKPADKNALKLKEEILKSGSNQ